MEFRVLGALEVREQGVRLPVGRPRTRAILGVLLTAPNTVLSVERLVDELWPDQPPVEARKLIHGSMSQLRRVLRSGGTSSDRVVTRKPGYLLQVEEDELDRHRYERLLARARVAGHAGQLPEALTAYREADRWWRGAPFADAPATTTIAAAVTSLTELRLTSLEEQYQVASQLGGDADLLSELTELVAAHPLRERLVAHLMRALHGAGRTAEAVDLYQQTRGRLADDLGIDPGAPLQELYTTILRGSSVLEPAPAAAASAPAVAVPAASAPAAPELVRPAQLPADPATFTGRGSELDQLLAQSGRPATVIINAIDGMAGIGKTALAVHAAHQLAPDCPDGQLFLDLHGHTEAITPVEPADALDRLLRALGTPADQIPHHLDDRAALYRSTLAGRRLLILLDNAATEDQIQPLLPGTPGCLARVSWLAVGAFAFALVKWGVGAGLVYDLTPGNPSA